MPEKKGLSLEGAAFWFAAIAAVAALGFGKGGVPVIAALAVPILSLVIDPIASAGLLLPLYIVTDMFALKLYRHHFDLAAIKIALAFMPVGVALGWATASIIPVSAVTLLVGLIGIAFVLGQFAGRHAPKEPLAADWRRGGLWCAVAGFTSFISHSGGAPWQVWALRLGLARDVYVGTSVVAFAYVNLVKLMPYYALGQINIGNLKVGVFLIVPAVVSVWIGRQLVKITPEEVFFRVVYFGLFLISVKLCWDGVRALLT